MIRRAALLALLAAVPAAAAAVAADYRLQQGDVLELVVLAPPMRERLPIDLDGNIILPLAGPIPAEGSSLAEVAARARERLAAAPPLPPASGEALPSPIWPAAVSLSLASYRPVYVGGEVRGPGAFPFAPGLTARRAILLAGGPGRLPEAAMRRLELEGDLARLGAERSAATGRLARLRAELEPAAAPGATPPLPALEAAILAQRREQDTRADAHFATAIRHTRGQIADLAARLASESEGASADRADFARIAGMREAGTATELRLSDARRALLFSTSRQLETATELARTTRELGSIEYEGLRRTLDLRLAALIDAAAAAHLLAELDTEIAATRRQLARLAPADAALAVTITASDGTTTSLAPGEDRPLHPGDLITVGFPRTD